MFCVNRECADYETTGAPSEYVDGVITCPTCGAELVEYLDPPEPMTFEPTPEVEVETVLTLTDPSELAVVKSILDGASIPHIVDGLERYSAFRSGDAAFRYHPEGGRVSIVVPSDRAEEARILLSEEETRGD